MNFQFQVRVDDDDSPDSDDLIDRVFIVGTNVAISETYTQSQTYTGIYNNVQMDMSYRVVCQTNYYGSTCNVNCEGRDDDLGHYECNSDGDRVCLSGWTGLPNCLTRKLMFIDSKAVRLQPPLSLVTDITSFRIAVTSHTYVTMHD